MRRFSVWKMTCGVLVVCAVTATVAYAQGFTSLASFDGTDGEKPTYSSLVQGLNGSAYGTAYSGGAGFGTVFRITSGGELTTGHTFDGADGSTPDTALLLASDGDFYGTTVFGGAHGYGTVFKMTRWGTLTTLHSFDGADGSEPVYALIQAADGDFYGTTFSGGTSGNGTIFRITPTGSLTTLHSFDGNDGSGPLAGLVQDAYGNYYGTTYIGGVQGDGTVFEFTSGHTLTTLHSFDGTDGANPYAGLIQAGDGNFYGTTYSGGANQSAGTVFRITPTGTLTTLYNFCAQTNCVDGSTPVAGLIQATDGNFYGTTIGGGDSGDGTIFTMTSAGALTTLHSFEATDGAQPYGGLLQGTNGDFYGTTMAGGTAGDGTVFDLSVGLGQFVSLGRYSGKVGQTGFILGQGFYGAMGVSFNGTPASFTVESGTYIRVVVPTGATSGYVTVDALGGTLTSNKPFQVLP
ncbi:MAG TPA: choice-of-anchor tandem repeat GloVer-containing protein [Terriglobales bacterium]|jgi:uncharacterized repeat protein (TIGR03803 family)|nr:choice-of-anchor tandem repeat GloVer-containing protein [Terriglobales bacterium]